MPASIRSAAPPTAEPCRPPTLRRRRWPRPPSAWGWALCRTRPAWRGPWGPWPAAPAPGGGRRWTAWRRGDGVLARMAAERALVSDANYRAASLLLDALDSCIDPRWVPALTSGRGRPRRRRTEGRRR